MFSGPEGISSQGPLQISFSAASHLFQVSRGSGHHACLLRGHSHAGQEAEETHASVCFLPNASCLQNPLGRAQAPQIRNTRETEAAEWGPEERGCPTSLGRPLHSKAGPLAGSCPWLSRIPLPTLLSKYNRAVQTCLEEGQQVRHWTENRSERALVTWALGGGGVRGRERNSPGAPVPPRVPLGWHSGDDGSEGKSLPWTC